MSSGMAMTLTPPLRICPKLFSLKQPPAAGKTVRARCLSRGSAFMSVDKLMPSARPAGWVGFMKSLCPDCMHKVWHLLLHLPMDRKSASSPLHMFGGTGNHVLGSLAFAHMQHTSFSVNMWPLPPGRMPPPPGCLPPPPG